MAPTIPPGCSWAHSIEHILRSFGCRCQPGVGVAAAMSAFDGTIRAS